MLKMSCDAAHNGMPIFSSPGFQFNRSNVARELNDTALLLNGKYPKNLCRGKTEYRKPKLVKAKAVIWRAGSKLPPMSWPRHRTGDACGLASAQNV